MRFKDSELLEAIQNDDLAFVTSARFEKPLEGLLPEDSPQLLLNIPTPLMVAAYYGSIKCFNYFKKVIDVNARDQVYS